MLPQVSASDDEVMRLTASIKQGRVTASLILAAVRSAP
jgi:hypothetical protein